MPYFKIATKTGFETNEIGFCIRKQGCKLLKVKASSLLTQLQVHDFVTHRLQATLN